MQLQGVLYCNYLSCDALSPGSHRFDYTGCGQSEGVFADCTVGSWKKDVLYMLDEIADGPQVDQISSLFIFVLFN